MGTTHPDQHTPPSSPRDEPRLDTRLSRRMSYVLRHAPDSVGIALDSAGWVDLDVLVAALDRPGSPVTTDAVHAVVTGCPKRRFALSSDGLRIRANQGHSVPVDLRLTPQVPPAVLFHGTTAHALPAILAEGLTPRGRHHVHLSADVATARAVGSRRGTPVVLTVDVASMHGAGAVFYRADNGVWLTAHVPAGHLLQRAPDQLG